MGSQSSTKMTPNGCLKVFKLAEADVYLAQYQSLAKTTERWDDYEIILVIDSSGSMWTRTGVYERYIPGLFEKLGYGLSKKYHILEFNSVLKYRFDTMDSVKKIRVGGGTDACLPAEYL